MNRPFLLALSATLLLLPLTMAHTNGDPYGIPKRYCEDVKNDREYHDFGPVASGSFAFSPTDGSLEPCPYAAGSENPIFDGHLEFAQGGAVLVAGDGDGVSYGATVCGWPYADHPEFPTVWVFDHVLSIIPADVFFSVYADTLNNVPPVDPNTPNCGDFESDFGVDCVNHCTVGFPAGRDGTYNVYVNGGLGHVWTNQR